MQKKLNVITLSVLAALMVTSCSRGMKSRYVDNPQTQTEVGLPDVNPHSGIPNDEPIPMELPGAEPLAVEPAIPIDAADPKPVVSSPTNPTSPQTPTTPAVRPSPTPSITPTIPPVVVKTPTQPAPSPTHALFSFLPLLWEKTVAAAKGWTQMIYSVIRTEESFLLGQNVADDVEIFCPSYRKLNEDQRLNFWGHFFSALAYHESSWNPVSRMVETTFTYKDSVTNMPVVSEGLLQLSYQDEGSYRLDCGFDWSKDKNLKAKDPRKTILDPYKNLRCGIKIMSIQLKKHRSITRSNNVYWAVLKTNGRYSKINQISASTRSLKICQK